MIFIQGETNWSIEPNSLATGPRQTEYLVGLWGRMNSSLNDSKIPDSFSKGPNLYHKWPQIPAALNTVKSKPPRL